MTFRSDSLGGKNGPRRGAGARSSRAHSANFNKLRKLDREITNLDLAIQSLKGSLYCKPFVLAGKIPKRAALDAERCAVRNKLKKYSLTP